MDNVEDMTMMLSLFTRVKDGQDGNADSMLLDIFTGEDITTERGKQQLEQLERLERLEDML